MPRLLITLGCSWTFGVGAIYTPGMTNDEYIEKAWQDTLCDAYSFRGIIAKQYNFINKNFSAPGSSNQMQFRLAKEFFISDEFKQLEKDYKDIVVLWGLTSTARNELYHIREQKLVTFFYNTDNPESRAMVDYFYDHDNEVKQLTTEMLFWNDYFTAKRIKNLWFDTFNHHNYTTTDIENLIFNNENPRDLLSLLAIQNGLEKPDNKYHLSEWAADTNRIRYLVKCGVLNPFSHHPTQLGHQQIADLLASFLEV